MPTPSITTSVIALLPFHGRERKRNDLAPVHLAAHIGCELERQAYPKHARIAYDRREHAYAFRQLHEHHAERNERLRPLVIAGRPVPHHRVAPERTAPRERNLLHIAAPAVRAD